MISTFPWLRMVCTSIHKTNKHHAVILKIKLGKIENCSSQSMKLQCTYTYEILFDIFILGTEG